MIKNTTNKAVPIHPLLTDTGFGLFFSCVIIGCCGWLLELFVYYMELNRLYDCGFLIMPWCPIYAVGILLVLYVSRRFFPRKLPFLLLSVISALVVTILEGVSGMLFYQVNLSLWNYSSWPLSNRFVSLPASILWGFGGAFFIRILYPRIVKKAAGFSPAARKVIIQSFIIIVLLDYLITFTIIYQNGGYSPLY